MKPSRLIQLSLVSALLLLTAACGGGADTAMESTTVSLGAETQVVPVNGGSYTDISAKGLAAKLENKDFVLVNVHIPYAGEIDSTDLFIPFDQMAQNLAQLPTNRDAEVVVYCRSGGMSAMSAAALVQAGYTNVWNLDGGMIAWTAAGETLLQSGS